MKLYLLGRTRKRMIRKSRKALGIILAAILLTMIFVAMAPSVAAQITIDGMGDDWVGLHPLAGYDSLEDSIMELNVSVCSGYQLNWSSGYDLADFAMYYNATSDTLYFKFNVSGVPGDTDGDFDADNCSYCDSDFNCTDPFDTWQRANSDGEGVQVGKYLVGLDTDVDGEEDYRVKYQFNRVYVMDPTENPITGDFSDNFTWMGSIGTPPWSEANVSNVVEMSITPAHNLTGFGTCNDFRVTTIFTGTTNDYVNEDGSGLSFTANHAPVCVAGASNACFCNNTTFDGSASDDPDGNITNWTWDFDDGNFGHGEIVEHHYANPGTYTVTLTVTDDYGFVCSDSVVIRIAPCTYRKTPILTIPGIIALLGLLSVFAVTSIKRRSKDN